MDYICWVCGLCLVCGFCFDLLFDWVGLILIGLCMMICLLLVGVLIVVLGGWCCEDSGLGSLIVVGLGCWLWLVVVFSVCFSLVG